MTLPQALYRAAQIRTVDRRAMEQYALGDGQLMERAGEAAYRLLRRRWPRARRVAVVCGPGNNGGDGFVVARHLHEAGNTPMVLATATAARGDAGAARARLLATGVPIHPFSPLALDGCDLIVDALLGTGLEREIRDTERVAVDAMNAHGAPCFALDLPSGLHADTGQVLGVAVRAQATLSFIGLKAGMFTGAGREMCGAIDCADLGVPPAVWSDLSPLAWRILPADLYPLLPRRARHAHKGDAGAVWVVGGAPGMGGAVRLAGEGAYRAGAGLVRVATHGQHAASLVGACPELMARGVATAQELRALLDRPGVIAVGPGLGTDAWGRALWSVVQEHPDLRIVDADALSLLARNALEREDWILTPHPGEAARLLGCSTADVQQDRYAAVSAISAAYGGVCVLKGNGTLIARNGDARVWLCDRGNAAMASGGTGDVLTGVIAGLCAQGLAPLDAARLGVWVHACAGDAVARAGRTGLMAHDLFAPIRAALHALDEPCN
jgi:NAD(P)H-hydrate epimerase